MAYTVTVTNTGDFHTTSCRFELNGTTYREAGTWTFGSKPTIVVRTGSPSANYQSKAYVTLNGETVHTGHGDYTLQTDDDTIEIAFAKNSSGSYSWWTADITTSQSDPMAPKDGHNTNIGAAAYQIEGGTVRFGGAAYEIESGMTRVNGVAWEIPFGNKIATVTISGTTNDLYAYATIGGSQITATGTTEYEAPLEITVYVSSANSSTSCKITKNGTTVKSGAGSYTFTTEAETVKIAFTKTGTAFGAYYTAAITEE